MAHFRRIRRAVSLSVGPGCQLDEMRDLGIRDIGEDIGQPGLSINTVELGRLHQRIGDGHGFAATC